ncbi:MAG: hypothetical protein INR73_26730 [Williamsia sp.]|nr:hypothetical protein [Williamsia sp.]
METEYTYTPSPDYIKPLSFDYLETYSLRGKNYDDEMKRLRSEYDSLKARDNLTLEEALRVEELSKLTGYTQYLFDENGKLHSSAIKTNRFSADSNEGKKLIQILNTEVRDMMHFLCSPVYRDAVVFYDKNGNRISTLNVCLSCHYMETEPFHHINAGYETYDMLKKWFIDNGHDVENPNHFITDDINKQKEKRNKTGMAK